MAIRSFSKEKKWPVKTQAILNYLSGEVKLSPSFIQID